MSWTLDVESQSLYVTLSDDAVAGQVEMPDGTIVDTDEAGRAVGIEVLRAGTPWDHQAVAVAVPPVEGRGGVPGFAFKNSGDDSSASPRAGGCPCLDLRPDSWRTASEHLDRE